MRPKPFTLEAEDDSRVESARGSTRVDWGVASRLFSDFEDKGSGAIQLLLMLLLLLLLVVVVLESASVTTDNALRSNGPSFMHLSRHCNAILTLTLGRADGIGVDGVGVDEVSDDGVACLEISEVVVTGRNVSL